MDSSTRPDSNTITLPVVLVAVLLFALVVVKTAWLSDDAFITLRTVANLHDGFGPVWNVDERVQSYTHPLWMLLLSAVIGISGEYYYTTILVSIACSIAALYILLRYICLARANILLVATAAILSKALTDYATSGLENPLTYLLLALFFRQMVSRPATSSRLFSLTLVAALAAVNRLDTILIFAPILAVEGWRLRRTAQQTLLPIAAGFTPLLLWELFSLFYYGFPLPNTAYAKLNTGIPLGEVLAQSGLYVLNGIGGDPITLTVLIVAIALPFLQRDRRTMPIAIGVLFYLSYMVWIGGDFMMGRFLAAPYFCALMLLAQQPLPGWTSPPVLAAWGVLLLVGLWNPPQSPVFSNMNYDQGAIAGTGIADERGHYYQQFGLLSSDRLNRLPEQGAVRGVADPADFQHCGIGMRGFMASPYTHIIDFCGLADPLLARLPAQYDPAWRIGHPIRHVPAGYSGTLRTGESLLVDTDLADYYRALRAVVAGPLWTKARFRELWRLNSGHYRGKIDGDRYRFPTVQSYHLAELQGWWDGIDAETDDGSGGLTFDYNGIRISLSSPTHTQLIDVGTDLDYGDIRYYLDDKLVGEASLQRAPLSLGGAVTQLMYAPEDAVAVGYDQIMIVPRRTGEFALTRFDPIVLGGEKTVRLDQLARLYYSIFYRGHGEVRTMLPALLTALGDADAAQWSNLPAPVTADLLRMPDPSLQQLIQTKRTMPILRNDRGVELLRYVGASGAGFVTDAGPEAGEADRVRQGVNLDLFFESLAPSLEDYTIWFHIVANHNDDQYMIYDYTPMAPTSSWSLGGVVRFSPVLKLAPGNYDISFGFWTPGERRRLTVDGSDVYWINLSPFEVPQGDPGESASTE